MKEEYKEIDIPGVIERLHMAEDRIKFLIKMTLDGDYMDKAEQAFASGNLEESQRAIHTIKGTAANVGLVGLSKLALEIELKIKENNCLDTELLALMREIWDELKVR